MRSHFDKLRTMCEDLASIRSPPGKDELYVIILGSLPLLCEPYISVLNATLSVLGMVLSTDKLMRTITDEYKCRNIGKGSKKKENAAFSTNEGGGKKREIKVKTWQLQQLWKTWPLGKGLLGGGWWQSWPRPTEKGKGERQEKGE